MSDFLLGVIVGVLIGWLFEYFVYRRHAEAQASERAHELKIAQAQLSKQSGEVEAKSAEINALRNKLAEAQSSNDASSAAQVEVTRLTADLDAVRAELAEKSSALESATSAAEQAAATAATELEEVRTKLANCEAELSAASGALVDPDELQRIEGIGPKVESVLMAAGIRTFAQLAAASTDQLRQILTDGGMTRINDPETWPEQAALAAAGNWDALETLQDELDGGRRR